MKEVLCVEFKDFVSVIVPPLARCVTLAKSSNAVIETHIEWDRGAWPQPNSEVFQEFGLFLRAVET